jgi:D-3-phosphoglycerate dehydrogenase
MTQRRSVLVGPAHYSSLCPSGKQLLLDSGLNLIENPHDRPLTVQETIAAASAGEIVAAIVGVESWTAEVLQSFPQLQLLTKLGVGVDNIDLMAARSQGVDVINAPGGNANAVAELVIGLILAVLRRIPLLDSRARRGDWSRTVGIELSGKTVGLYGFGNIAQKTARRLIGFDCTVLAFDPFPNIEQAKDLNVRLVSQDELLSCSDILSLHAPLLPNTSGMVNDEFISRMKRGAVLINAARGGLVNEDALFIALTSNHLSGAGLDVFCVEPALPQNPLFKLENIVVTNHAAADSRQAYEAIGIMNADAILARQQGLTPLNIVN